MSRSYSDSFFSADIIAQISYEKELFMICKEKFNYNKEDAGYRISQLLHFGLDLNIFDKVSIAKTGLRRVNNSCMLVLRLYVP